MTTTTVPQPPEQIDRSARLYRRLLVLYPSEFRSEYGDDLVQGFGDLMVFSSDNRGVWWRTARDLVSSASHERLSSFKKNRRESVHLVLAAIAGLVALIVVGPGPAGALVFPLIALPVVALVGLPVYGLSQLREAWLVRRTTGAHVARHVAIGLGSFAPGAALLIVITMLGEDAGYLIFVAVSLTLIGGSVLGIVWAVSTLVASRHDAVAHRWRRPALALVPSVAVLAFIIGASYNSYRNSLGPPGDHSVENASADTRALWEAADAGDLDAVVRLTTTTCADPWVKFPVGNGRHNAKGQAESRGLELSGEIADVLGFYQNDWNERCGEGAN